MYRLFNKKFFPLDSTRSPRPSIRGPDLPYNSAPPRHHTECGRDMRHRPGHRRGDGDAPGAHSVEEDIRAPV